MEESLLLCTGTKSMKFEKIGYISLTFLLGGVNPRNQKRSFNTKKIRSFAPVTLYLNSDKSESLPLLLRKMRPERFALYFKSD